MKTTVIASLVLFGCGYVGLLYITEQNDIRESNARVQQFTAQYMQEIQQLEPPIVATEPLNYCIGDGVCKSSSTEVTEDDNTYIGYAAAQRVTHDQ